MNINKPVDLEGRPLDKDLSEQEKNNAANHVNLNLDADTADLMNQNNSVNNEHVRRKIERARDGVVSKMGVFLTQLHDALIRGGETLPDANEKAKAAIDNSLDLLVNYIVDLELPKLSILLSKLDINIERKNIGGAKGAGGVNIRHIIASREGAKAKDSSMQAAAEMRIQEKFALAKTADCNKAKAAKPEGPRETDEADAGEGKDGKYQRLCLTEPFQPVHETKADDLDANEYELPQGENYATPAAR